VGTHPLIIGFCKGIFNIKPPQPRYVFSWDPVLLINYIEGMGINDDLSLADLIKKLVCLLTLTKACRSSNICALDLDGMMR
jgi:hypothetical protein